jgi:hypothetical protein
MNNRHPGTAQILSQTTQTPPAPPANLSFAKETSVIKGTGQKNSQKGALPSIARGR